jgi:hypothetical protein
MRKYVALGTLTVLGFAGSAAAEGFSYSNLEASYVSTGIDSLGLDGDGFAIGASFEFAPRIFGYTSINDLDYDSGSGVSTSAITLGLGASWRLGSDLDLVSGVSYEHLKLKVKGLGSSSDSGIGVNVGLRGRFGANFEYTPNLKYTDLGHGINDFTWTLGTRYYFSPNFAAGIDLSDNDDGTTWNIAVRYDFGARQ